FGSRGGVALPRLMVTRLQTFCGIHGVIFGSCLDARHSWTMLAHGLAAGKASALPSFKTAACKRASSTGGAIRTPPPHQAEFAYFSGAAGLILKARRCSRFASTCGSVFVPASLSLSMMA